jgi:hypothetical protein
MNEDLLAAVATDCAAFNVRKASRVITRLYAEALAAVELEPTQFTLLVACSRQQSIPISVMAGRQQNLSTETAEKSAAAAHHRGLWKQKTAISGTRIPLWFQKISIRHRNAFPASAVVRPYAVTIPNWFNDNSADMSKNRSVAFFGRFVLRRRVPVVASCVPAATE